MENSDERFGRCVPRDATIDERIEAAAALLLLDDPAKLRRALEDAGLVIVTDDFLEETHG